MSLGDYPNLPIIATANMEPAMHVSLAGQSDQQADAAPEEATSVESDDISAILRTIEEVARARNHSAAVEAIVSATATECPHATVRCGLGSHRLKRFFDHKLGWLGPESSLHNAAEAKWHDLPLDQAACHPFAGGVAICVPEIGGAGKCVIWIEGEQVREDSVAWIVRGLHTLQVVFWHRSARSWLRPFKSLGLGASVWLSMALTVLLLIAIWPIQYRIGCTAVVEPLQQRLVATPFEATLLKNHVRPGDAVRAGDVLVELDGRPLRLELESIESEIQQASKQHDIALATGKVAEAQQASLKERQLSRQRDLLSDRLNRLEVVSPIDGVIVAGDLDRFIGSPLKLGQTLVEVAPLDRMVIQIEIPEHEIGYVSSGAETKINLASIGGRSIRASLDDLYPTAEIRDDRNVFIGRTEIENVDGQLRPGMRGEATTYGPLRPVVWCWVRRAYEKVLWWAGY